MIDVEFTDEIILSKEKHGTYVVVHASGEVDKDRYVSNVKINNVYSKDHSKDIELREIPMTELAGLMERIKNQLVEKSEKYDQVLNVGNYND